MVGFPYHNPTSKTLLYNTLCFGDYISYIASVSFDTTSPETLIPISKSMKRTPDKIYTLTQAAQLCGTHRVTLWRWIKAGKLRGYQNPAGQYRIKADDLMQFIRRELPFIDLEKSEPNRGILVVDDDPLFRKLVKRMFSAKEFRIEEAANGFEAGAKIMKFMPAVVILDLFMEKMDGFDLCRQIKRNADTRQIKIIAVTGRTLPEIEKRIRQLGADAYLEKPFEISELKECIDQLIH